MLRGFCYLMALLLPAASALAQSDAGELARKAQNPVADMVSLPFQLNWNFDVGPLEKDQQILNIQPVYPISLNEGWNLIIRTSVPLRSQPPFLDGQGRENGIGDINLSAPEDAGPLGHRRADQQRVDGLGAGYQPDPAHRQAAGESAAIVLLQRRTTGLAARYQIRAQAVLLFLK